MSHPQPFRLLDLPPELRNRIYTFVFEDTTYNITSHSDSAPAGAPTSVYPGILASNKQIHTETKLLFYATAHFTADSDAGLFYWLSKLTRTSTTAITRLTRRLHVSERIIHSRLGSNGFFVELHELKLARLRAHLKGKEYESVAGVLEVQFYGTSCGVRLWPREGAGQKFQMDG